jgi:ubiquitin-protein ligase
MDAELATSIRSVYPNDITYNEDDFYYYYTININSKNIKIAFNESYIFCISTEYDDDIKDTINLKLSKLNINTVKYQKIIKCITDIINQDNQSDEITDYLHLFGVHKKKTKFEYNIDDIDDEYKQNNSYKMIMSEIDRYNTNLTHKNYISFNNNPFDMNLHLQYEKVSVSSEVRTFNYSKQNYEMAHSSYINNEVVINILLDHTTYPLSPPKISIVSPSFDIILLSSINKMNIFRTGWNSVITLDWICNKFFTEFEEYFVKYLLKDEYNDLDINIIKLIDYYNVDFDYIDVNFKHLDFNEKDKKYWSSGTGYGTHNDKSHFDVKKYLFEQKNNISKAIEIFNKILTIDNNDGKYVDIILFAVIKQIIFGCSLLDFTNNPILYITTINIIDKFNFYSKLDNIETLYEEISNIYEDVDTYESFNDDCKKLFVLYLEKFKHTQLTEKIDFNPTDDVVEIYKNMVKSEIINYYELDTSHIFYKYKDNQISKKSLMRIVPEIAGLKRHLPINWDSSCILRTSKKNSNLITFVITGPKDTPYHNGVFEFHAYFPDGYPKVVPKVLIKTTDGGKVRFNPNLYANGKVCLSLLGTWSGGQGEGWSAEISTFLQVIISIQSLIFVEQPYFNEPGYESSMNTPNGKEKSFNYNDERRYQTLRVAIVNQLKNSPEPYKDFIKKHFEMKKNEINQVVNQWIKESKSYKKHMKKLLTEFNNFF